MSDLESIKKQKTIFGKAQRALAIAKRKIDWRLAGGKTAEEISKAKAERKRLAKLASEAAHRIKSMEAAMARRERINAKGTKKASTNAPAAK